MSFDTMIDLDPAAAEVFPSDPRRRFPRVKTCLSVRLTFVGPRGECHDHGDAILADLSVGGLRLSSLRLRGRGYPFHARFIVVTPRNGGLQGLCIKAKPIHGRFETSGVEVGAEIERISRDIAELFDHG